MKEEPQTERPKQYWETIRELEKEMFPEFRNEDIYGPQNNSNLYFAPSWHFRSGLITETDVKDFLSDNLKRLLSIGSGAAFLEKLLARLGINKDNIVLSDINPKGLPPDFKSKTIDMYGNWGGLGNEQYNLIIFPESVLINVKFNTDEQRQDALYHIISQSLQHLSPDGTIRINGHSQVPWNIDAVIEKLKNEGHKIKITSTRNLIEVKNETSPNTAYLVHKNII